MPVFQVKSQEAYAILFSGIIRPTDLLLPTSFLVVIAFILGVFGVVLARKRPGKILLTVVSGGVQKGRHLTTLHHRQTHTCMHHRCKCTLTYMHVHTHTVSVFHSLTPVFSASHPSNW